MSKYVIGLMTGTSVDGIDTALTKISGYGIHTKEELICFFSFPIPDDVKEAIFAASSMERSNVQLICELNYKLGYLYADAVKRICEMANIPLSKIAAVGSHGQTIYHMPMDTGRQTGSTFQIGEAAIIAYETGITVVSNFRGMDMAAGGMGAPLVPYVDYCLYRQKHVGQILQNIGGIGNATVLPRDCALNDVYAFDTGPGNMIIDALCRRFFDDQYDAGGSRAAKGSVNQPLINQWMELDYLRKVPPKATGREDFGEDFINYWCNQYPSISPLDWIATATCFTAQSIATAYQDFIFPNTEIDAIVLSGGGSRNATIIQMLKKHLPGYNIQTQEDIGYSSEAKEAIAFAILANETLHSQPSNLPKVTGAKKAVVLGQVTYPSEGI